MRRLRKHLTSHSEERPFSCDLCDKKFKRKHEVSAHMRVHDGSMSFECDFCSKKLRSKGSWMIHRRRHLKDYVAKCEICSQGFVTNQEYNNHMGSKHSTSNHICNICGRGCYDKAALQGHMARHAEDYENNQSIRCELCKKKKTYSLKSRQIERKVEFSDGKRNTKLKCCHQCGKLFKDTRRLKRHLTSHNEARPYSCELCNKKFKMKQTVLAHLRIHDAGGMSFECDFCTKKLRSKGSWMIHRKRHLKDYVAKCEICCQGFVTKQEYDNHIGSKHGKSNYICNVCNKSYCDKASLQGHMVLHTENYGNNQNIVCELSKKQRTKRVKKELDPDYVCPKIRDTSYQVFPKEETDSKIYENLMKFSCELCDEKIESSIAFALHSIKHSSDNRYFDPTVLNNLVYGPGISITPVKQETYDYSYTANNLNNFNPFNGYNGYNPFMNQLRDPETKLTEKCQSSKFQKIVSKQVGLPNSNILDCLVKKPKKKKPEKPKNNIEKNIPSPPVDLDEPIHCEVCNETYKNNVAFALHSLKHSEDGKYTCHLCEYRNASKYHIEMHIRAHEGTTKYKCEICGKAFTMKNTSSEMPGELIDLNKIKKEPKPHKIKKEKKDKRGKKGRRKKIDIVHPPPIELDEPIQCDVCSDTYKNNVAFSLHSKSHSEDGKYSCHICNYRNASKYHIEMHVRAHEGTTSYKCEICNKAFTVSTHAMEHKYFHSGEKPFQCEICGKHFMFSRFLASHRRTQHWEIITGTPLIKYDCNICKKHYTSSSGLKRHNLRNHNTEGIDTSVLCDICGKKISSNEKLKFHRRVHTGYKPFACEVCGKCFSTKEQKKRTFKSAYR
ncbi:hypothetical protein NQ314_009251 [Rhamnusium bicolor]|uniref:C2H2-type domain-containing protein n=1 Tax=Rhamnusium bicolor TaxID=1586634 RepID=A0AAV8Y1X1_9CUCU|nr:hypothetical protein NQ314_009251 [Rhamnusium bicolor]